MKREMTKIERLLIAMFQTARDIHNANPDDLDAIDNGMLDMILVVVEQGMKLHDEASRGSKLVN